MITSMVIDPALFFISSDYWAADFPCVSAEVRSVFAGYSVAVTSVGALPSLGETACGGVSIIGSAYKHRSSYSKDDDSENDVYHR